MSKKHKIGDVVCISCQWYKTDTDEGEFSSCNNPENPKSHCPVSGTRSKLVLCINKNATGNCVDYRKMNMITKIRRFLWQFNKLGE